MPALNVLCKVFIDNYNEKKVPIDIFTHYFDGQKRTKGRDHICVGNFYQCPCIPAYFLTIFVIQTTYPSAICLFLKMHVNYYKYKHRMFIEYYQYKFRIPLSEILGSII